MFGKHTSCRQWDFDQVARVKIFKSQEKAAAGEQGGHLVVIVLPTVAIMRMDVTENKGDNLAWMGSKNKGRE